jgi:hypothetical protein
MLARRMMLVSLLGLGLAGCDSDDDGLSNKEEKELGTDPKVADSDGDGLSDGDEVLTFGSDPLSVDSDGDGCEDGREVDAAADPADPTSTIYAGGWPCMGPMSAELVDPGWTPVAAVGGKVPHFIAQDQFEEEVDLYDFAGHGKFMIIDLSGIWCGWCKMMSGWLDEQENATWDNAHGEKDWYVPLRDLINSGEVYWITVIDAGGSAAGTSSADLPTAGDVAWWYENYPNPEIPLLLDANHNMRDWFDTPSWPRVMLVGPDMTILEYGGSYSDILSRTLEWYASNQ